MQLPVSRAVLAVLALVALGVGIANMGRQLANPDEGRYSEISREMAASGDWVTPRLNGIKYFEKPPLQYWATALAYRAFGEGEWVSRLYVGLCGLATILLIGYTALRLGDEKSALAAMLALVSSPYFMALGGIVTLDMGLTLWTTLTFCALLLAERSRQDMDAQRRWMLVAWAAMALAVLSKGLVGIVFAGAAVFFQMVLARDPSVLKRMRWGWGLGVFLVLAAPWFVLVSRSNPEFAQFFFIHEHFTRFLTSEHRRVEPWWFFVPILVAGFLPWMFALFAAGVDAWRAEAGEREQPLRLSLAWAAFIVAFFSASGSKLPAYILPAFPPLALVLGRYLARAPERRLALWSALALPFALVLAFAAWRAPEMTRDPWARTLYADAHGWALAAAIALFAGLLAATALLWRAKRWPALVTVALASILTIGGLERAYERLTPRQSGYGVAQLMKPLIAPGTRIYSVGYYDQTLPFYIGRPVTLVNYVDEFETGLKAEPGSDIPLLADFPAQWLRPGDALAIMHPGSFEEMKTAGLPMQVLHSDPRRVLVRKP
jgi:4-amino-4-deoxy-L-arabinose transferase-like glycosyltransferase